MPGCLTSPGAQQSLPPPTAWTAPEAPEMLGAILHCAVSAVPTALLLPCHTAALHRASNVVCTQL
eukprot:8582633-Alexandrium_andersonii.AAC.1